MKKIVLYSILLLLTSVNSNAQKVIKVRAYTQARQFDFDDRDTGGYFTVNNAASDNIWKLGKPSKNLFSSAHSAPFALVTDTLNSYPVNKKSAFEFVIDFDDYVVVTFWHRFETDSLKDGGVVEISGDNGLTWQNVISSSYIYSTTTFYTATNTISSYDSQPGFTGTSAGWIHSRFDWFPKKNTYRIRFTFASDDINTNKAGWIIDDLVVHCLGSGAVPQFEHNSPIHVFPNPVLDVINIQAEASVKIVSATVKDLLGKTILTTNKNLIDVKTLEVGIYIVTVVTDKKTYLSRIVKQ